MLRNAVFILVGLMDILKDKFFKKHTKTKVLMLKKKSEADTGRQLSGHAPTLSRSGAILFHLRDPTYYFPTTSRRMKAKTHYRVSTPAAVLHFLLDLPHRRSSILCAYAHFPDAECPLLLRWSQKSDPDPNIFINQTALGKLRQERRQCSTQAPQP